MTKYLSIIIALLIVVAGYAQPTHEYTDAEKKFKQAKEFIQKEDYAFAYPLLIELKNDLPKGNAQYGYYRDGVKFYEILCGLQLQKENAKDEAIEFIKGNESGQANVLAFHLGHYFYLTGGYEEAVYYYNRAGNSNLSNEQIAQSKFEKAYALFSIKNYADAKPLFNEIHQIPSNKYYIPASYYFALLAYKEKEYDEALKAFAITEKDDRYKQVSPYYIADIYNATGKKDDALRYGETAIQQGLEPQFDLQLRLLLGQLYFEKKDFAKALPYLKSYADASATITKEVLYQLSYAQYMQGEYDNAMQGFRRLSSEKNELGQNSMYILGDLYLKKGDKANARNAFQFGAYNNSNAEQQRISLFNYAKLSYELGYQDLALKELKNYLNKYPKSDVDVEAKSILVDLLANSNNYDEALALYNTISNPAVSLQKVYPRILFGKATNLINDQQISEAESLLAKAVAAKYADDMLPYIIFWQGEIAYSQKQYGNAIRYYTNYLSYNAASLGEANANNARYGLGYSYFQLENYRQALAQFELIAKSVSPTAGQVQQDAYLRSADCYFMLREFEKANGMYAAIVNAALPSADYAMYQQAMILGIRSSKDKIAMLENLLKRYPATGLADDVNMEIAQAYISSEKFSEALPYLQKIINSGVAGNKPKALSKLGLAYFNANKNVEALQAYRKLLSEYPTSAEADEAQQVVKDIYIEEGKPADYLELMQSLGRSVSVNEADSLIYTAAYNKYVVGNCAEAIKALGDYAAKFPQGRFVTNAYFYKAQCLQKAKDWSNAIQAYNYVIDKGLGAFYELSLLEAARINYIELKDYGVAKKYFEALYKNSVSASNKLEALRGLVRSYYQIKDYSNALSISKELLASKNISADDKAIASLVLGKSQQLSGDFNAAINSFKAVAAINKASWGAEARYELANCYFKQKNYNATEKAAMAVIKETGSYDLWVAKAYLLLGDLFMVQKDYFNAKATYESIAKNASIPEIKSEAQAKLDLAIEAEKANSKLQD